MYPLAYVANKFLKHVMYTNNHTYQFTNAKLDNVCDTNEFYNLYQNILRVSNPL